jgi:hypothetical protein
VRYLIPLLLCVILSGCDDDANQSFLAVERTQGVVFGETVWGEGTW